MMKKENMKKKSTARKLLPAAGMLAVSASMLATSTYAWFTMNKEVQVNGLQMKTKVGSNLLISSDNVEANYSSDRVVFARQALLEPVSTVSGKTGSFFYTTDAKATGQKAHSASDTGFAYIKYDEKDALAGSATSDAVAGKYKYDDAFNDKYGIADADQGSTDAYKTAYGYIDYVFYLKATGEEANQQLRMTQCDLNYTYPTSGDPATPTEPGDGDDAWRVAVFATDITANGGKGNTGSGAAVGAIDPANVSGENAKTILALSTSENWDGKAVSGETATTAITYGTAAVLDNDIDAGVTKYYKVLVRVWLEGEDKSCNSATYAQLTNEWSLDLDFQLTSSTEEETGKTAVTRITKNSWAPDNAQTQPAVTSPVEVVTAATP